jgi:hypothetical protein
MDVDGARIVAAILFVIVLAILVIRIRAKRSKE